MADLTIAAADVALVKGWKQYTGPAGEAINAGQYVHFDTTTGKFVLGDAGLAADARQGGIALTSANQAGITITVLTEGIIDVGDALAALTYDDDVYLSNTAGTLADAAGTVPTLVARVVPGWAAATADKLLEIHP